jgi:hypothetical protein
MIRLRTLQAFEVFLVLSLLFGVVAEFRNPQWPSLIGFAVNILWQYMTLSAIRRLKSIAQLSPADQSAAMSRQRARLKPLFIGSFSLFAVLMISVGLFLSHAFSTRTFAFIVITTSTLTFGFLVFSFTRLQKRQR